MRNTTKIRTCKVPPTDTRGTKITARDTDGHAITRSYDYASNDPHRDVAAELAKRLGYVLTGVEGRSHDRQEIPRGYRFHAATPDRASV